MREVLTFDHWAFPEFCRRLERRLDGGCGGCLGEAVKVMREMADIGVDIDIVGTAEWLGCAGIRCSCEVLNPPDDPLKNPWFHDGDDQPEE
jgi:hypothetical protein